MKRRKNFLFSGSKPYEVRVYIYGKKGYEAQGEQNIKRKKFSDIRAAHRWFEANEDYPLVELVDLKKDHIVFSGGTGRFNPRKRKKPQMPKRRDVYAEMAKSRKTTRGHKRKDRKRSVAKGSSRKPKHKMRLNPFSYDKPNKEKGVFDANVKKRHGKLFGLYKGFYNALEEAGIEIEDLPPMTDLRDESMRAAVAIESTRFPELKGQSYETIPAAQAAKEALGIDEDGIFAPYSRKYGSFLKTPLKSLTEEIKKNQATVKKVRGKTSTAVSTAKEDAELAKVEREIQARLQPQTYSSDSPVAAQEAQQASMYQRESASELLDDEEPLTPEQEEAFSKKRRSQSRARRISRYEGHVSETRRTDVAPPLSVVADARQDVLLYALKDGTTQVWSKGAITETFLPSKKTPSVTFAHRYANWWRGLDGRGKIRDGAKKSRLRSRVLLAVEGKKGVKEIEPSVVQSLGHVQQDVIGTHELPNLDKYELKGDRANPFVDKDFKRLSDSPKETVWGSQKHSCIIRVRHHFPHRPVLWECSDGRHGEANSVPEAVSAIKGGRANPLDIDGLFGPSRADWPWAFFGEDGKVYDEPPEHVRFRAKRVRPAELKRLLKGDRANPRRRKNTGWPAKIGPYKLKEVTDEYTWDRKNRHELATYGPFLIRSWSRDYYPDYWTVTMTGTPAVREAWGEVYGGRVMYAKADAIGFLDEHLRACGNPHNRANPRRRKKESKRAFVERVWSERAPRLPSHSYGPRRGLEGPFQFRSGKVLYYDPREGAYYDPDSDMYLSDSEAEAFIMNPRRKNSSVRYRVMYNSVDGSGYYKKEGEPRTWATKEAAIRFADSKQDNSDQFHESGNPWGYYYSVHTDTYPSRVVYRTR